MTEQEIVEKLTAASKAYYNSGNTILSDAEFDDLEDELRKINPESEWFSRIGEDDGSDFPKAKHTMLMGSQSKVNSYEEELKWMKGFNKGDEFTLGQKLDGISLELNYENGKLTQAITRGDGHVGDDITANAKKFQGVQKTLKSDYTGAIRGEILLFHKDKDIYFPEMKNCRNAASGLAKTKNGKGSEHLTFVSYDAQYLDENKVFPSDEAKYQFLEDNGFKVAKWEKFTYTTAEETASKAMALMNVYTTEEIDYDIDGVVVKLNKINNTDLRTNERPHTQHAIKPSRKEYVSTLKEIKWQMTGSTLCPIAIFEPIEMDGATCSRASLSNLRQLVELDIHPGDKVVVTRRGLILPHVERKYVEE